MPQNAPSSTITIDGQPLGPAGELLPLRVRCETGMDGVGACTLELICPTGATLPKPGAALTVALGLDGDESTVFTGEIEAVRATDSRLTVHAADALARLAYTHVTGTYEAQSPGQIVRDLLSQSELPVKRAAEGPELASYVVFPQLSVLRHVERLGALMGAALHVDGAGQAHFTTADQTGASFEFAWGAGLLSLDLELAGSARAGVDVWGEGSAGSQGSEKSHWLPAALDGLEGSADVDAARKFTASGPRRAFVQDGALRTGEAAQAAADGRAGALARPLRGVIEVTGVAAIAPTDTVQISDLPDGHPLAALLREGTLRVRRVRHELDVTRGFTTRLEF